MQKDSNAAPVSAEYFPWEHDAQSSEASCRAGSVAAPAKYFPGGHSVQSDDPGEPAMRPAEQTVHEAEPAEA